MNWAYLAAAGVLGGLTGSIAGLASVATSPALLLVGLPPVTANVTNTVALVFNGIGSVLGSRPALVGERRRIRRLAPIGIPGGLPGGLVLRTTPSSAFAFVVPWLIGLASLAIVIQPQRAPRPPGQARRP